MWAGWIAICNANDNTAYRTKTRTQTKIPANGQGTGREKGTEESTKENRRLLRFHAGNLFLVPFFLSDDLYRDVSCNRPALNSIPPKHSFPYSCYNALLPRSNKKQITYGNNYVGRAAFVRKFHRGWKK